MTCIENDIRLTQTATIKSPDNNVGRVELCRNRKWGTITLDLDPKVQFWSQKNVQVACRQLGFSGGLNSIPSSKSVDTKTIKELVRGLAGLYTNLYDTCSEEGWDRSR